MTIGVTTKKTKVAVKVETTEKTYAAPTLASDFFTPLEYPTTSIERETVERNFLTNDIGKAKSLQGMKSSGLEFGQEFRGSGDGGVEPEWGTNAKAVLGTVDNRTDDVTLTSGSTTTVLEFSTAADLIKFTSLDALLVKDTDNEYNVRFVKYHGSTQVVDATNNKLDISETGEVVITLTNATYNSPDDLAVEMQRAINADSSLSADYSVVYSETTGKYTISRTGGNFSILWQTGTNGSGGTDNHIGDDIGFDDAADDTGTTTYTADAEAYTNLTISPALDNAPATSIVVTGASTYKRLNMGHPSVSYTVYQGDEITDKLVGCKGTSMSIGNLTTGQIPQLNFVFQGLSYNAQVDGGSVITPNYQDQLPPIALAADVLQDGTSVSLNNVSLEIAQEVTKVNDMTDAAGAVSQFASSVSVTGNMDPWMDDASVAHFTKFDNSTDFELLIVVGDKDSSSNWIEGSIVAIYLPQCVYTDFGQEDADGLLRRALGFQAHRGNTGEEDEIAIAAL